eukprot:354471-Chlamydomonas_euryale.AAC.3
MSGLHSRSALDAQTSRTSRGTWVLQDSRMLAQTSDGPWDVTASPDCRRGEIQARRAPGRCDFDVWSGRRQDRCDDLCCGRQAAGSRRRSRLSASTIKSLNIAGWPGWPVQTTATDLAGFLRISWERSDGMAFHPVGLTWACHEVWWDFQEPWTLQALSFEVTGSRGRAVELYPGLLNGALCNN